MAQRTFWRFSEDLDSFLESNKMKEKLKEYLSTHDIDNDIATEVKKVRAEGIYLAILKIGVKRMLRKKLKNILLPRDKESAKEVSSATKYEPARALLLKGHR